MNDSNRILTCLFNTELARLQQQCATLSGAPNNESLFDLYLFQPIPNVTSRKEQLSAYLEQIADHLMLLQRQNGSTNPQARIYLITKICDQLLAFRRELASQPLAPEDVQGDKESRYDTHCRYLSYERRLKAMKLQLQKHLEQDRADPHQRMDWNQQLATLERRLGRCRNAIAHLEDQL